MYKNEQKLISILQSEMFSFMTNAKSAKDIVFTDDIDKEIKCLAVLTRAISHLAYAKAIYQLGIDDKRDTIDDVFLQSDIFISEITTNIETDHSHQWTDIEFNTLAQKYDCSELVTQQYFSE